MEEGISWIKRLRNFLNFMECRGLLLHLKQPTPSSYPQPDQSIPLLKIHFNIVLLSTPRSLNVSFLQGFVPKPRILLYPIHARYPEHYILPDLVTRIMFGEEYRSLSFSLCSSFQSLATSSIFVYSPASSAYVTPSIWETTFYTSINEMKNYTVAYFNLYIFG